MTRRGLIEKALDDISAMKACPGHEWIGPIEEIHFPDWTDHQIQCKHCPLRKGVATIERARELIEESNE